MSLRSESPLLHFSFEKTDDLGFCPHCQRLLPLTCFSDAEGHCISVERHEGQRECRTCVVGPAMLTLGPLNTEGEHAWISWTLRDCGIVETTTQAMA